MFDRLGWNKDKEDKYDQLAQQFDFNIERERNSVQLSNDSITIDYHTKDKMITVRFKSHQQEMRGFDFDLNDVNTELPELLAHSNFSGFLMALTRYGDFRFDSNQLIGMGEITDEFMQTILDFDNLITLVKETSVELKIAGHQSYLCRNCGENIDEGDEECSGCGATLPNCIICFKRDRVEEMILYSCCESIVHRDCILRAEESKPVEHCYYCREVQFQFKQIIDD